ncbi:hypothetical protein AGMMS49579_25380 [Spirochaetia bacterium]|nr:hypothetical protein AGMMS49579_25380 [Spirochaetia bacterium]
MYCSNCGNQIRDDVNSCPNCGNAIENAELYRHGFTSFWLYFSIIGWNIIFLFAPLLKILPDDFKNYINEYINKAIYSGWNLLLYGVSDTFCIIGSIQLLNWKKKGFTNYVIGQIFICIADILYSNLSGGIIVSVIIDIISIVIMYGVLHLGKKELYLNKRNAWMQLKGSMFR